MRTGSTPRARSSSSARTAWAACSGPRPPPSSSASQAEAASSGRSSGSRSSAARSASRSARSGAPWADSRASTWQSSSAAATEGSCAERGGEPPQRLGVGAVLGEHLAPGGGAPRRVARLQPEAGDLDGELPAGRPGRAGEAATRGRRSARRGGRPGTAPPRRRSRRRGRPGRGSASCRQTRAASSACPRSCSSISATRRSRALRVRRSVAAAAAPARKARASSVKSPVRAAAASSWRRVARRAGSVTSAQERMRTASAGIAERIQRHLGCPQQERGPVGRVPLGARPATRRARRREASPRRPRAAAAARAPRAGSPGPRGAPPPASPGRGRVPGSERHLGAPQPQRRVLGPAGSGGEVALQRRERLGLAPRVDVGLEEVKGGLVVGGVEVEGARERLAWRPPRRRTGPSPAGRGAGSTATARGQVARARGEPGQLLPEGRPVAALAVPPLQQVEGARVPRRRQPGAVEGLARHRRAVRVVGHVERREPQPGPGRVAPVALAAGAVLQRRRLIAPGARRALQAVQRLGRARDGTVEEHGLHRGIEGEPVLEWLVGQQPPEPRVGLGQLGPVATGLAPAVEEPLRVAVPAERLGAGHRPPPRLGQVRGQPDGPPVVEDGPVAPTEPLLPPAGERQVAGGGLGRALRAVGLLLEHRGHAHQVSGLLPDAGERAEHLRVAGLEGLRPQQQPLGPGQRRRARRAPARRPAAGVPRPGRRRPPRGPPARGGTAARASRGFVRRRSRSTEFVRVGGLIGLDAHRTHGSAGRAIRRTPGTRVLMRRGAGANRQPRCAPSFAIGWPISPVGRPSRSCSPRPSRPPRPVRPPPARG